MNKFSKAFEINKISKLNKNYRYLEFALCFLVSKIIIIIIMIIMIIIMIIIIIYTFMSSLLAE